LEGALRVTIWNEFRHERNNEEVAKIYPEGLHSTLANALGEKGFDVRTATLAEAIGRRRPDARVKAAIVREVDRSLDRELLVGQRNAAEPVLRYARDPACHAERLLRRGADIGGFVGRLRNRRHG